ncbi:MAG: glycosyltransferase [Clostridia bacterium]|nr:glycosyltransferase [Clostridia bacterium]
MNILMLIDALQLGGAETHVVTLARAMAARGEKVTVLSGGGELESTLRQAGIAHYRFPASLRTPLGLVRGATYLHSLLKAEHFDVLHAHTRRCALLLRTVRSAARSCVWQDGAPLPATYRRRGLLRAMAPLRVVTAHAMFRPRFRRLSYWGECTISVSEDIRDHLLCRFGGQAGHRSVAVIGNGVVLCDRAHTAQKEDAGVFSIVFASRLDADCSRVAELLLRISPALAKAAKAAGRALRLCILGGGGEYGHLCQLREQILAAHPSTLQGEQITLMGSVADPARYFGAAQVFVGVSRAALEALGCGCRVILAGNEGYGGILTPDNFAYFARSNFCCRGEREGSETALLADLQQLMVEDATRSHDICCALGQLLRQHYDIRVVAQQTLRLYARALAQKRQLQVLFVGYFGRDNLGDEAILRCLARRFSGAAAPRSLAFAPWYSAAPTKAMQRFCSHARGRNTSYYARRALLTVRGDMFPAHCAVYRPQVPLRGTPSPCPSFAPIPLRIVPTVLSHTVQPIGNGKLRYAGMHAIPRGSVRRLLRTLRTADAMLLGGGELLQNVSRRGNLSLSYYLALPMLARICGCPFSMRACGVGDIRGSAARWTIGAVMRQATDLSLREHSSLDRLARYGVPRTHLGLLEDGVAAWVRRSERHTSCAPLPPSLKDGFVCICPRMSDEQTLMQLSAIAEQLAPSLPRVYLAIGGADDLAACRALWAREWGDIMLLHSEYAARALLCRAELLLSMRLHALVLGAGCGRRIAIPSRASEVKMETFEEL